jgi:hypothetical protein
MRGKLEIMLILNGKRPETLINQGREEEGLEMTE